MSNHEEIHSEQVRHPEVSYDRTDLSPKAVFGFLLGLAIAGVLIHFTLWGMYKYLSKQDFQSQPVSPRIGTGARQPAPQGDPALTFPEPRLQADPVADLSKFRQREEQVLNSYGWIDQKAGVARIPIDRAMQIVVQRGLPARQQPPQSAAQTKYASGGKVPGVKK